MRMTQEPNPTAYDLPEHPLHEFKRFQRVLTDVLAWAQKNKNGPEAFPPGPDSDFLIASWLSEKHNAWEKKILQAQNRAARSYKDFPTYLRVITRAVSTPEPLNKLTQIFPNFDWEKAFGSNGATPAPRGSPSTVPAAVKRKSSAPREKTISQYVTANAPSILYVRAYILISRHTVNRFSRRGQQVYPYGHEYLARELRVSRRTAYYIFSWLRRKHIVFKRSAENRDRHKCATWFVCTSWKQSAYFRDPEGRRRKKESPGSR